MAWRPDLLAGRVALVTGASRGIGRATAAALLSAGAEVYLHGRSEGALADAVAELSATYPGKVHGVHFDMTDPAAVRSGFMTVHRAAKRLDILVNNAGILRDALIEMASVEMMDEVWAVNLRGLMVASQYAARIMARSGGGSMINLSSIMGRVGNAGQAVYAASKAGVIGVTLSLAKELASRKIRVNAVAPGLIATDMIAAIPAAKRDELVARIGLGRPGTAEDVANLIVFLASDLAAYVTGQVIGVDGGLVV